MLEHAGIGVFNCVQTRHKSVHSRQFGSGVIAEFVTSAASPPVATSTNAVADTTVRKVITPRLDRIR